MNEQQSLEREDFFREFLSETAEIFFAVHHSQLVNKRSELHKKYRGTNEVLASTDYCLQVHDFFFFSFFSIYGSLFLNFIEVLRD